MLLEFLKLIYVSLPWCSGYNLISTYLDQWNEKVAQLFFVLDLTKDKPKDGSCAYAAWSGMCILKADQISDFISCEGAPWAATILLHGK